MGFIHGITNGITGDRGMTGFKISKTMMIGGITIALGALGTIVGLGLWMGGQRPESADAPDETLENSQSSAQIAASVSADQADQDVLRSLPQWDGPPRTPQTIGFTDPKDRLQNVKVGRADPFAATETIVVNVSPQTIAPAPTVSYPQPNLQPNLQTIPTVSIPGAPPALVEGNFPPAPPVPQTVAVSAVPPALPAPVSPTHLADRLEIKGVVELENQWQAIVREPDSTQSKTVQAGDALAGGQVKVRRIERSRDGLLQIVLEQNGIEVIRPVS